MAGVRFAEASLRQDELTDSTENQSVECLAPPLAPLGTTSSVKIVLREHTRYGHEDDLNHPEQNDLSGSRASFSTRRKLVAAVTVVAALSVCACAYFFLASSNDKADHQTAEASATVQPILASPVQTTLNASGSSVEAAGSESLSSRSLARPADVIDASQKAEPVYASGKAEPIDASQKAQSGASQRIVSTAVPRTTESRKSVAAGTEDILFLQRPGVNIRSTPSTSGKVVGTTPKGTRFKVTSREADWVQVQNGRLKGWINAQFLAPTEPR
jgi:hypothetical protein